jgi:hypothetical protein
MSNASSIKPQHYITLNHTTVFIRQFQTLPYYYYYYFKAMNYNSKHLQTSHTDFSSSLLAVQLSSVENNKQKSN